MKEGRSERDEKGARELSSGIVDDFLREEGVSCSCGGVYWGFG